MFYLLALDGVGEIGHFTKVSGISVDITPVEYNATRDGSSYLKTMRPGRTAYGDIEFSRGLRTTHSKSGPTRSRRRHRRCRSNGSIVVMSADELHRRVQLLQRMAISLVGPIPEFQRRNRRRVLDRCG